MLCSDSGMVKPGSVSVRFGIDGTSKGMERKGEEIQRNVQEVEKEYKEEICSGGG